MPRERTARAVIDTVTAATIGVLDLLLQRGTAPVVFAAVLVAAIAVRRTFPVASAALVTVTAFVQWLVIPQVGLLAADLAVPLAVHAVAAHGPRPLSRAMFTAGLVGAGLGATTWPPVPEADLQSHLLFGAALAALVLAGWALGALHRVREERIVALTERARLLEVERDQKALLAVTAERTRIAREMHDVVAHSLAVVISQADGGRYANSPEAAQQALATISETGRRAMSDTRHLLGLLRAEDSRAPQPGLADVSSLVAQARSDGLDVDLDLDPGLTLAPGLGLAVYRIVQEGLTNVVKHAGPAVRASVEIRCTPVELLVSVIDDGRGAAAGPGTTAPSTTASNASVIGGHGLVGIQERVAAYGGDVRAGPARAGGHELQARIPMLTP
ncbi:sensor histidine kinase [Cryptosporangium phraense]|uniref:histidine kinase n=1 Tax=Cryptosporangium phraense TaxID=2593070 RepID=A0A545ADW1_9ACTN|nr:histidine kinase [Cryptosporangium phraense]TQS39499.1 two-component sensor histidine kinase [Cryptosporangium phraense]